MAEIPSLFDHVFEQPPTALRMPNENLTTEIIAYFLEACGPFRREFLRKVDSTYNAENVWTIETRKKLESPDTIYDGKYPEYHGKFPDLYLTCPSERIAGIIEVKIDAGETSGMNDGERIFQVKLYEEYLKARKSRGMVGDVFLGTVTRWPPDGILMADGTVTRMTFTHVADWLEKAADEEKQPAVKALAKQWAEFLQKRDWAIRPLTQADIDAFVSDNPNESKNRIFDIFSHVGESAVAKARLIHANELAPVKHRDRDCKLTSDSRCWPGPKVIRRRGALGLDPKDEVVPGFIYGVKNGAAFLRPVVIAGTNFHATTLNYACAEGVKRDPYGWNKDIIELRDLAAVVSDIGKIEASDWERVAADLTEVLSVLATAGRITEEE